MKLPYLTVFAFPRFTDILQVLTIVNKRAFSVFREEDLGRGTTIFISIAPVFSFPQHTFELEHVNLGV